MNESKQIAQRLLDEMIDLRRRILAGAESLLRRWHPSVESTAFGASARNLAAYLAFRRRDLRVLQKALSSLGLSSLGRSEAHVLPTLDAVISSLRAIAASRVRSISPRPARHEFDYGYRTLKRRANLMLGTPEGRTVRIMVTLPSTAATDRAWVRQIIVEGTDCVRINCAHDHEDVWMKMIRNVRAAAREAGRRCRVVMDLCGPRARIESVLPAIEDLRVKCGDRVLFTKGTLRRRAGFPLQARTGIPEILDVLNAGAKVWINEGRIGAVVEDRRDEGLVVRVTHAREKGEKLRSEMALNFPDADLRIPPLTPRDLETLDFVVRHADVVGYSFVQTPEDASMILGELDIRRSRFRRTEKLGLIAKIETERAVRNLPEIIIRAAPRGPFGVMIARGDLAVELGFQRIAEMQEEILWICEAAHVPVIWATQVLESLAKKGLPTRAEITDAAMSQRAECVMLNKGPFVVDAVRVLDGLLRQTSAHYEKKTPRLRALRSWEHLHAN